MGQILVTGATGFIGYEVAVQLCKRGHRPRFLVRRPLRGALLSSLAGESIQGDLEQPESLARAVSGVDTIIHLGARAVFEEYELVRPTIVEGSAALMKAAISAGVKRFVFASSLLVYENQKVPIDRMTKASSELGYGKAKREAEAKLSKLAEDSSLAFAAVRLPHVYGARDLMFEQVRRGRVYFPGHGRNQFAHLHVTDAARVLIEVAERGWTGISAVSDNISTSWNEFFSEIKKYYPRFSELGVPKWLATFGTYLISPLRRLRNFPSVYTPDAVRSWNLNLPVKPGLLWQDLNLKPVYETIYQGIPAALDECVAFRWQHPVLDRVG